MSEKLFFTSSCWWCLKLKASKDRLHKPSFVEHYLSISLEWGFMHDVSFAKQNLELQTRVRGDRSWTRGCVKMTRLVQASPSLCSSSILMLPKRLGLTLQSSSCKIASDSSPLTHSVTLPSQLAEPVQIVAAPNISHSEFRRVKLFVFLVLEKRLKLWIQLKPNSL